jgi:hypothetical protein
MEIGSKLGVGQGLELLVVHGERFVAGTLEGQPPRGSIERRDRALMKNRPTTRHSLSRRNASRRLRRQDRLHDVPCRVVRGLGEARTPIFNRPAARRRSPIRTCSLEARKIVHPKTNLFDQLLVAGSGGKLQGTLVARQGAFARSFFFSRRGVLDEVIRGLDQPEDSDVFGIHGAECRRKMPVIRPPMRDCADESNAFGVI